MAKDLYIPVTLRGNKLEAKAQLGQTVIVTEGPEEYTGPVTVTPSESQQTLLTKDKLLTDNVTVNPIPSEYIIPTGTEEISVTENGTVSRDVKAKERVTVNVDVPIPQPTGTKEISISENGEKTVDVSGFALAHILTSVPVPQGGFEYETGTYIPATTEVPTIYFANTHSTAPSIIIFADVTETGETGTNRLTSWSYIDYNAFLGSGIRQTVETVHNAIFVGSRVNASNTITFQSGEYTQNNVTSSYFKTYMIGNFGYHSAREGRTYKWVAIWT